ncbi:COG4315 family predicted lipoprotein [Streptomyces apocyni]|uniref:COG4315 family predicted lipoprotein n=1 Tax=Streptomyces apocyni TaxID=2654677 RepID=UPI0012E9BACD|nr:hypothetical protein [Streptomyces apocyni]
MRVRITLLAVPLVLVLAACGGGGSDTAATGSGVDASPPVSAPPTAPPDSPPATEAHAPGHESEPDPESDSDATEESASTGASGGQDTTPATPPSAPPTIAVKAVNSDLGRILTDQSGRTLYGFTKDKAGSSNCDADCIAVWPALVSPSKISAGQGVQNTLLDQTAQGTGLVQAVYGDWPLYYYVGDTAPGDVNGQGLDEEWFAVSPNGKLIK